MSKYLNFIKKVIGGGKNYPPPMALVSIGFIGIMPNAF